MHTEYTVNICVMIEGDTHSLAYIHTHYTFVYNHMYQTHILYYNISYIYIHIYIILHYLKLRALNVALRSWMKLREV